MRINQILVDNLVWFAGSLILAFFVWMTALLQSDPIQQQPFSERITVQMTPDTGLLITGNSIPTTRVVLQAPQSVLDLLTADEIEVFANLAGLGPGTHSVELQWSLARQQARIVDLSPRQIRVTLETADTRQVPIRAVIIGEPPPGFSYDEPVFDVNLNQVRVSGPASKVEQVLVAQVELDLTDELNPMTLDLRLTPVDTNGAAVSEVTVDPQIVGVAVNVRRRDDVREVRVRPNIVGVPPSGYVLSAFSYAPQVVLVSGSAEALGNLPDTLPTQPIDLEDRTDSFDETVAVQLPSSDILLFSGQTVTVSVEINALTTTRQFESIPVGIIGLPEGLSARLSPLEVTVLLTGAQPVLETLDTDNIQVTVDLNGLSAGNYQREPVVTVTQGQFQAANISVLPAEIDVEILAVTATPESDPP